MDFLQHLSVQAQQTKKFILLAPYNERLSTKPILRAANAVCHC